MDKQCQWSTGKAQGNQWGRGHRKSQPDCEAGSHVQWLPAVHALPASLPFQSGPAKPSAHPALTGEDCSSCQRLPAAPSDLHSHVLSHPAAPEVPKIKQHNPISSLCPYIREAQIAAATRDQPQEFQCLFLFIIVLFYFQTVSWIAFVVRGAMEEKKICVLKSLRAGGSGRGDNRRAALARNTSFFFKAITNVDANNKAEYTHTPCTPNTSLVLCFFQKPCKLTRKSQVFSSSCCNFLPLQEAATSKGFMAGSRPACMQVWEEIHVSVFSYTRRDHQGFPFTLLGVASLLITTAGLVCAKETQPMSTAGCLGDTSTFICVCKTRADLVASAACLLAWLSWISISLRSPSIFFLRRMASFLLRASESRVDCSESMARCWFLLERTWRMDGMIFLSVQETEVFVAVLHFSERLPASLFLTDTGSTHG